MCALVWGHSPRWGCTSKGSPHVFRTPLACVTLSVAISPLCQPQKLLVPKLASFCAPSPTPTFLDAPSPRNTATRVPGVPLKKIANFEPQVVLGRLPGRIGRQHETQSVPSAHRSFRRKFLAKSVHGVMSHTFHPLNVSWYRFCGAHDRVCVIGVRRRCWTSGGSKTCPHASISGGTCPRSSN